MVLITSCRPLPSHPVCLLEFSGCAVHKEANLHQAIQNKLGALLICAFIQNGCVCGIWVTKTMKRMCSSRNISPLDMCGSGTTFHSVWSVTVYIVRTRAASLLAHALIHKLLPSSLHSCAPSHTAMSWDGDLTQLKTNPMKGSFQWFISLPHSKMSINIGGQKDRTEAELEKKESNQWQPQF